MLDHHEIRLWADHHADFSAWAGRLVDTALAASAALVRIQYAAPWQADRDAAAPAARTDVCSGQCPT